MTEPLPKTLLAVSPSPRVRGLLKSADLLRARVADRMSDLQEQIRANPSPDLEMRLLQAISSNAIAFKSALAECFELQAIEESDE